MPDICPLSNANNKTFLQKEGKGRSSFSMTTFPCSPGESRRRAFLRRCKWPTVCSTATNRTKKPSLRCSSSRENNRCRSSSMELLFLLAKFHPPYFIPLAYSNADEQQGRRKESKLYDFHFPVTNKLFLRRFFQKFTLSVQAEYAKFVFHRVNFRGAARISSKRKK